MKKVKVLFGIFASLAMIVGMASCSKEDNDIDNNASIIGTWGCVHNTYTYIRSDDPDYPRNEEDRYVGQTIVFKDDGTYTSSKHFLSEHVRYIFRDANWMIDGSTLFLSGGFATQKFIIQTLTKDKLILIIKTWSTGNNIVYEEPAEWVSYEEILFEFRRQN